MLLEHLDKAFLCVVSGVLSKTLGDDEHGLCEGLDSQSLLSSHLVLVLLQGLKERNVSISFPLHDLVKYHT